MSGRVATLGKIWRAGFVASLLLCLPTTVHSADSDKLERGKAILHEKCGRCHAVGAVGESPLKLAPQCATFTHDTRHESCRRS